MNFDDARLLDQMCYAAKLADYPRGLNRAKIAQHFNGWPPYSDQEVEENGIEVNVNFLEGCRLAHDSRAQFAQGFIKPGKYFSARTDYGPRWKRNEYGIIVSREANRTLKKSVPYFETTRGKFAQIVLHGIAPAVWQDSDRWRPRIKGIEDVLLPAGTEVGFDNLPWIILYRSFTAMELQKLTSGTHVDPGWNMEYVNGCLKWADSEASQLMYQNWPEIWAPEKQEERLKSQSGYYTGDQVPTIDCFDIYAYVDDGKEAGWIRRIILDAWAQPAQSGNGLVMNRRSKLKSLNKVGSNDFLYNSKDRKVACSLKNIISFQFGDLSAVAPFKYHSIRSLGYLLYSVCHIQNRLRCRFIENLFESLMMYFRVKNSSDAQNVLKIDLVNRGIIDEALQFVPAQERFQIRSDLVALGLTENGNIIKNNAASFSPSPDFARDRTEKTKFQVMAEMNITTNLVSAALNQAYQYQTYEYAEIFRRLCKPQSTDPDARTFQANCIRQGVPEDLLDIELWDIEPERVLGAGNKTMEISIAEWLMANRPMFDPEAQRIILRDSTRAITDNPALADVLVPEEPHISDSIHDAQLAAGTLMQSLPVAPKSGINHSEYIEALLASMAVVIDRIAKTDNMGTIQDITGLNNIAQHIGEHMTMMEPDPTQAKALKVFGDQLGKLMNLVKGFGQRLMEKMQQEGQNNGGPDAELQAKIQAEIIRAQAKAQNTRESHAQRTAQRQVQWEMEQQRENQAFMLEQQRESQRTAAEIQRETAKAVAEGIRERIKAKPESEEEKTKPKSK